MIIDFHIASLLFYVIIASFQSYPNAFKDEKIMDNLVTSIPRKISVGFYGEWFDWLQIDG